MRKKDDLHQNVHVVALSSCRPVSKAVRQRRVVVRRVVSMSPCRLAYMPILQFEPSDNVTSRQHAVWHAALETRQDDTASANATHKSVPNQVSYLCASYRR
jgi:hypothetical protein